MELTLTVDKDLARKIKGLSVLTGKTANDITDDVSQYIEKHITRQLIEAVGIKPEDLAGGEMTGAQAEHRAGLMYPVGFKQDISSTTLTTTSTEDDYSGAPSTADALVFPSEDEEDSFGVGESLGDSEEDFDKYDDELPDHMVEKLDNSKLPKEEQERILMPKEEAPIYVEAETEEEEIQMAIKDKDGNDSGYADPIMAELQDELDSGGLDGMIEEDYDLDDDEREFEEDVPARKARVTGSIPSDAPAAEGYENISPDVLPMDYGIGKVSTEDGQASGGAMDFFNHAFEGDVGDKTARNNVQRKRIITDF